MKPSLLLPDGKTCGVDEAGRGPLAGPVFAAAVILDPQKPIAGLNDSKKLSARRRETLAEEIRTNALAWAIASATVDEIDEINILQASLLAMKRAVVQLNPQPSLAEVDGNRCPVLDIPARAIIKGDSTHAHIAAASILAKTARDALMLEMARQYPNYGFEKHMGYGTALHLHMLKTHGPCPIHRRSFAPVTALLGLPA